MTTQPQNKTQATPGATGAGAAAGAASRETVTSRGTTTVADGVVAKCGAEGFWACGTADGWGVALRVLDGAARAWPPAGMWAVRTFLADVLGADLATPALDAIASPQVLDGKGVTVGGVVIGAAEGR